MYSVRRQYKQHNYTFENIPIYIFTHMRTHVYAKFDIYMYTHVYVHTYVYVRISFYFLKIQNGY